LKIEGGGWWVVRALGMHTLLTSGENIAWLPMKMKNKYPPLAAEYRQHNTGRSDGIAEETDKRSGGR
jgi:hypothetical protein